MRWQPGRIRQVKVMGGIVFTKDCFLWCLSAIYLFAFSSLYHQIPGLYGNNGILPVNAILKRSNKTIEECLTERPTLLWYAAELGLDYVGMMELISLSGIIVSFLSILCHRIRDCLTFGVLWILYFSVYQVGQVFMWFQWDILLLEVGFLAIILAPLNLLKRKTPVFYQHDAINFWLVRWLLFRLMFASGVVKLTSLCPTWWGLTALHYHFESQCIPTPFAWFAHHLPQWLLRLGVVGTYLVEIPVPLLFFSPVRSLRLFSFFCQVFFQIMIIISGNYNFFNLLTITLCISLLDDEYFSDNIHSIDVLRQYSSKLHSVKSFFKKAFQWIVYLGLIYWTVALFSLQFRPDFTIHSEIAFTKQQFHQVLEIVLRFTIWMGAFSLISVILQSFYKSLVVEKGIESKIKAALGSLFYGILALAIFGISLIPHTVVDKEVHSEVWPILREWHDNVNRFHIVNSYGLFRRMTGVNGRPEVIVEGSFSGDSGWQEYEFFYKPSRLDTSPSIIIPHQPRLDWQMWFAALSTYNDNPWFISFIYRLLYNEKDVLALLSHNPFPKDPPKFIRATLYKYRFTPFDSKKRKKNPHHWWKRKKVGEFMPVISKQNTSVIQYLKKLGITQKKKNQALVKSKLLKRIIETTRDLCAKISAQSFIWSVLFTALAIKSFRTH